jgi:D-3-phosphoglycerate dehydrogenase
MRILLTTTSYQDTPGKHHGLLEASGLEVVRARGPLSEPQMLELIRDRGPFDATLNGDDALTPKVIDALLPKCKCLAKYGIGLDSIDVSYATEQKLAVLFTPGVNHTTVAEHAIGLMIAVAKHFYAHASAVKNGQWERQTGVELMGKTLGVVGLGRIGREVVKRGNVMGMRIVAHDILWDEDFARTFAVERAHTLDDLLGRSEVVTLHTALSEQTRGMINAETLSLLPDGAILVNTARGGLVDEPAVADACRSGKLYGYGTDVLEREPLQPPHPFLELDNVIITPHVGSRTVESVERQAVRATKNVVNFLSGEGDYIQANEL